MVRAGRDGSWGQVGASAVRVQVRVRGSMGREELRATEAVRRGVETQDMKMGDPNQHSWIASGSDVHLVHCAISILLRLSVSRVQSRQHKAQSPAVASESRWVPGVLRQRLTTLEGLKLERWCRKDRRHWIFMAGDAPTRIEDEASDGANAIAVR